MAVCILQTTLSNSQSIFSYSVCNPSFWLDRQGLNMTFHLSNNCSIKYFGSFCKSCTLHCKIAKPAPNNMSKRPRFGERALWIYLVAWGRHMITRFGAFEGVWYLFKAFIFFPLEELVSLEFMALRAACYLCRELLMLSGCLPAT